MKTVTGLFSIIYQVLCAVPLVLGLVVMSHRGTFQSYTLFLFAIRAVITLLK